MFGFFVCFVLVGVYCNDSAFTKVIFFLYIKDKLLLFLLMLVFCEYVTTHDKNSPVALAKSSILCSSSKHIYICLSSLCFLHTFQASPFWNIVPVLVKKGFRSVYVGIQMH